MIDDKSLLIVYRREVVTMHKFFNRLRRAVFGLAAVSGLSAFAEGEASSTIDVGAATSAIQSLQTAVGTYWDSARPVIIYIVGLALVALLIWVGFKLVRRAVSKVG